MADEKEYLQRLNQARKRRNQSPYPRYAAIAAAVVLAVAAAVLVGRAVLSRSGTGSRSQESEAVPANDTAPADIILSPEGENDEQELAKKQAVVDSYENLGFVQVSGYLNVREEPVIDPSNIIGKLQENGVCEILSEEGEWYHISSGGIEGYISSQYVLTGEEARAKALEYVTKKAIVLTDGVNIRQEPVLDPSNIIGQALTDERYTVEEELGEWVKISSGYIYAEYVDVQYALNEARKLDLKAMALNQYKNLVISKVNNYQNIRSEPNQNDDSNIIGKFPSKAAGELLETQDGWYKIQSGPITGYILANPEWVAVGQEARDLAMESATLTAIVKVDGLRVRLEPNTESTIWTQVTKEERYAVTDQLDGWVQIELDAGDSDDGETPDKAYLSTRDNNVEVRYALAEAIKFSPLEEKANQESSRRSKIVNYALQFVGGRYVWGGTNPNTGADCSGFVQYVMRNAAGISLPRTSREQAKVGRAVSSSEMKPGDLIFYANSKGTVNHVAMYIGNGQIVHAASRRSGIRISTWNYRSPKTIRRMIE